MAVNEQVSKGRLYRRCLNVAQNLWERISFWTSSEDVELRNGTTLDSGIIDDITTINSNTTSGMIAGAKAVKQLSQNVESSINSKLGGLTFGQASNGKWGYKVGGADTVIPFNKGNYKITVNFSIWAKTHNSEGNPENTTYGSKTITIMDGKISSYDSSGFSGNSPWIDGGSGAIAYYTFTITSVTITEL